MLDVAEISRETFQLKNGGGYINGVFIIDPSDAGKESIEKGSARDNQQKHASMPTRSLLVVIRQSQWMLPLIYTHIWMSAAFAIVQPFFPPLVGAFLIPT